ncbi:uncharacterized protein I303_106780 [Kwoniella dejecticola CBS 10117]|uniref:GPI inositol-deacylase n=1 Tax=Kwoniella dejecticola CBS 10117 TaxID=1296121 RepID=A0AAJ8KV91_9TREE
MSWMSPSYHAVEWHDPPNHRYQLFLYREQGMDLQTSLTGRPVLFIPGNAGSYQQVRSIASAASRQHTVQQDWKGPDGGGRQLDFFSVDFNEEFSAFSARTLHDQANYIKSAIDRIFREYDHLPLSQRPSQVILLAHSMGGIAARLAISDEEIAAKVDVLLTMSTPHTIPPLTIERDMDAIYSKIAKPAHPLHISLCGGVSDTQVVSDSCALPPNIVSADDGFAVFTTGVPAAWTGVDHQAIVWCHQVRWLIAKSLLKMAQAGSRAEKLSIARENFLGDHETVSPSGGDMRNVTVSTTNMTILLRAKADAKAERASIKHCVDDCHIVPFSSHLIPFPKDLNAPFPMPGEGIKPEESLLAINVNALQDKGFISVTSDTHDIVAAGPHMVLTTSKSTWTIEHQGATSLTIRFSDFIPSTLLVRRLRISTPKCEGFRPIVQYASVSRLQSTTENRFYPHVHQTVYLHSHLGAAPFRPWRESQVKVALRVYQQEQCPIHEVQLSTHVRGTLAKIVSRYRMTFLAWPMGWTALAMLTQIRGFSREGRLPTLSESFILLGKRWVLGVCLLLVTANLAQISLRESPQLESLLLGTMEIVFVPLIVLMAIWTYGLTCLMWLLLRTAISTTMKIRQRLDTQSPISDPVTPQTQQMSRKLLRAGLPLLLVHLFIPHQVAFLISLTVLWTCVAWTYTSEESAEFGMTISFLMTLLAPYKAVSLVVWGRSLWMDWYHPLATDHNLFYAGPALLIVGLYVQGGLPKRRDLAIAAYSAGLLVLATSAFVLGSRWTWILPPIAHTVLLLLAFAIW